MHVRTTVTGLVLGGVVLVACGGGADTGGADTGVTGDATSAQVTPEAAVAEGEPAPEVTFETFAGEQAALSDFHGDRPVVVNFWASWCPPCVAEMPDFEEVHQQFADRVRFLGINTQDERSEADRLVDETGVTYTLALDPEGEIFQTFGVFGMPSTFLITADGRLVDSHTGLLTKDALVDKIRSLLLEGEA